MSAQSEEVSEINKISIEEKVRSTLLWFCRNSDGSFRKNEAKYFIEQFKINLERIKDGDSVLFN